MPPSAIEFDMLSVGDADAILVTAWFGDQTIHTLVDAGTASDASTVTDLLAYRGITHLHNVLCTHLHQDHAGGVEELLRVGDTAVGTVWLHDLDLAVDWAFLEFLSSLGLYEKTVSGLLDIRTRAAQIRALARAVGADVRHPFKGDGIGGLEVCGPSNRLFAEIYSATGVLAELEKMKSGRRDRELHDLVLTAMGDDAAQSALGGEPTDPINESSVILGTKVAGRTCLLTGDAGIRGLTEVASHYDLRGLHLLQVPHHGSRRNMSETLVQHFSPTIAAISCTGSRKHPSQALVNALKRTGSTVYSTHYPHREHLRFWCGNLGLRPGYRWATSLYNAS